MSKLPSITTDLDHYQRAYEAFEKHVGKNEVFREWATNVFPSIVLDCSGPNRLKPDTFSSLGIGSGSGILELDYLLEISNQHPNIHHTVIEPSEAYVLEYQSLVSSPDTDVQGITFNWFSDSFQHYKKSLMEEERKFDFISAVNSLYYVEDLQKTLHLLYKSLRKGGILMITLRSDLSTGFKVHSFQVKNNLLPSCASTLSVSSATIAEILHDLGIPFQRHILRPLTVDIADVFDPDSEEGNLKLDHFTEVLHFRQSASVDIVDLTLQFLKDDHVSRNGSDTNSITYNIQWETLIVRGE